MAWNAGYSSIKSLDDMKVKNAVVVITGASSGIGRATALELARREANLVLVARREGALHALADECERLGGQAIAIPTDVAIEDHVYGVARRAIERFGKIDVWINNAAVTLAGHFEEIPMEDFKRVIDINLFGYIHGARAVVPQFRKQGGGTLINVASIVAVTGEPYFTPYAVSKFAIRGLSASLHQELSKENIHVCSVLPSTIDTPLYNQAANYMGKEIVAPGNAIPAEKVADEIIGLIKNPKPEVSVGTSSGLAATLRAIVPDMFDKRTEKHIYQEHFDLERQMANSRGNLYEPMREFASISGGWIQNGKMQNFMKYFIPLSVLTGAAAGLALYFKNRQLNESAAK